MFATFLIQPPGTLAVILPGAHCPLVEFCSQNTVAHSPAPGMKRGFLLHYCLSLLYYLRYGEMLKGLFPSSFNVERWLCPIFCIEELENKVNPREVLKCPPGNEVRISCYWCWNLHDCSVPWSNRIFQTSPFKLHGKARGCVKLLTPALEDEVRLYWDP